MKKGKTKKTILLPMAGHAGIQEYELIPFKKENGKTPMKTAQPTADTKNAWLLASADKMAFAPKPCTIRDGMLYTLATEWVMALDQKTKTLKPYRINHVGARPDDPIALTDT